ncbi:HAMP domain-containing histidine kinase [Macrococcoides goetzii]|nr:HAMP domain-containing sensor histidine kinase [Macrococcus goetzii]TDM46275.1 HAMP domain-containing histidine kinase [Macrococcus goetzii]
MKNKKLLKKYFYIMAFGVFLIPVTFILLNYLFLLTYTGFTYVFNFDWKFQSSFFYVNFYIFYFIFLLFLVWIGSKYFEKVISRINNIHSTVERITYDESFPDKLIYHLDSEDEINALSGAINKLIDRLRFKEALLEQQNKTKQEHIKQLSHDINTPLTAIMLELYELAIEYEIPEEKINQIYSKIMYTNQLVKKVSETEEIDYEDQYIFMVDCSIDSFVTNSLMKWNYLLEKNKISIKTNLDENVIWKSEALFFERLLDNIFSNIIRHSHTEKLIINLNQNKLEIIDFGIGYDVNQVSNDTKGNKIIRNICEKLNIELNIMSSNKGTRYLLVYR